MNFREYIEENGLKTSYLCKKLGVTRQTLYRINTGEPISPELAARIRELLSSDIELPISQSQANHIRRRKNTALNS